jgi:hypothetical protein
MKLLVNVLFWSLLTVVIFAACYWLTSAFAGLLVHIAPETAARTRSLTLSSSLVLTPVALVGLTRLLIRR